MTATVSYKIGYGWDSYSVLVLGIIFTGCIPLSVGLGVTSGLAWNSDAGVVARCFIGLATALVTFGALLGLLWLCGTSKRFRQWFIPLARRAFPPPPS